MRELNFEVRGSGPALLMCNGLGASLDTWGRFGEILEQHFTLITFDAPGCGASPVSWLPYRMSELAAQVVSQARELGFDKAHVLGFSFGGMLAQQIAHQHRTFVDRLVLVSTLSGVPGLVGAPHVLALACNPLRFVSTTVAETLAPLLYGGDAGTLSGKRPALLGVAHQISAVASWFGVHGIAAPTLVLGGSDDPLTPVGNVQAIVNRHHDAIGIEVPDGGHLWVLNKPDVSAQMVLRHLTAAMRLKETA